MEMIRLGRHGPPSQCTVDKRGTRLTDVHMSHTLTYVHSSRIHSPLLSPCTPCRGSPVQLLKEGGRVWNYNVHMYVYQREVLQWLYGFGHVAQCFAMGAHIPVSPSSLILASNSAKRETGYQLLFPPSPTCKSPWILTH